MQSQEKELTVFIRRRKAIVYVFNAALKEISLIIFYTVTDRKFSYLPFKSCFLPLLVSPLNNQYTL